MASVPRALSVFDMNTKSVVCLKEGRILQAMEGWRDTLIHTRALLLSRHQNQTSQPRAIQCSIPPLSLFTVPLYCPPTDVESAHCPLFDRAFVVGGDDDSEHWTTNAHCRNVTLGVLLYNLALSHHLCAFQKGALAANEYQTAMSLYRMALTLVDTSIPADEQTKECQNLLLLLCAIFNNMANIHYRHLRVEDTRNCLECLKEIVVNNYETVITEEDHFFFYLNLFVTAPVHEFAIAPAA